jgi:hypothetical protein
LIAATAAARKSKITRNAAITAAMWIASGSARKLKKRKFQSMHVGKEKTPWQGRLGK